METSKSFFQRISTELALYIICTCIAAYWIFQIIGIGFILGVIFGIVSLALGEIYIFIKLFSYEDYLRKSSEIEDNRAYWNDKIKNYHQIRDKTFTFKMVK